MRTVRVRCQLGTSDHPPHLGSTGWGSLDQGISAPDALSLLQFGDFFNGAQVMIDTFISSAESEPSICDPFHSMSLQTTYSEMAPPERHCAAPSPRSGRCRAGTLFLSLGTHVTSGGCLATTRLLSLTMILSRSCRMTDTAPIRKSPTSTCTLHSQRHLHSISTF